MTRVASIIRLIRSKTNPESGNPPVPAGKKLPFIVVDWELLVGIFTTIN